MSEKNHPNFHAVQFSVDIICSIHNCLRNEDLLDKQIIDRDLLDKITKFSFDVEKHVDAIL